MTRLFSERKKRLSTKLESLGDDCENANYHGEAALYRDAAAALRNGQFNGLSDTGDQFLDGEKVIQFLLDKGIPY